MNIQQGIERAVQVLHEAATGDQRLTAESLMMFTLGRERAYLYAHPETALTEEQQKRFEDALARRAAGIPLQYITGKQEFWGLEFQVSPAVLIPRPETEHLVEAALDLARKIERPRIVDVGTGSGCILLALAHELSQAELYGVDISGEALAMATSNAERLGLSSRVKLVQGDLLQPFLSQSMEFDLVVSNPPYVGTAEPDKVQREVREHEPAVAVFAGESGMEIYRRLIPQAWTALKPGGYLLIEIGYSMEAAIDELLSQWQERRSIADLQGIPRVVVARKPY
jgi:release factor glutamine methyltransferase